MFFMRCPKCGADNDFSAVECIGCGVILAKATRRERPDDEERIRDGRLGPDEWKSLGIGLAAAILVYALPLTRFIFGTLVTLFHELGHAIAGWLMGYPSIPAFDFVYGGGLTHHGAFQKAIVIAVALVFAYAAWLFRENRKSVAIVGALFLVWLYFVTREWRREIVFAAAGHMGELILAGIFFYKALAGRSQRALSAFVAFFVQMHTVLFAWSLLNDAAFLDHYREGKGGALMHDLEVIALNLQIWLGVTPGIEGAARALLAFSFVPTIVALVWYLERARWHRVLRALRTIEG
jgi:hypothetical protein